MRNDECPIKEKQKKEKKGEKKSVRRRLTVGSLPSRLSKVRDPIACSLIDVVQTKRRSIDRERTLPPPSPFSRKKKEARRVINKKKKKKEGTDSEEEQNVGYEGDEHVDANRPPSRPRRKFHRLPTHEVQHQPNWPQKDDVPQADETKEELSVYIYRERQTMISGRDK